MIVYRYCVAGNGNFTMKQAPFLDDIGFLKLSLKYELMSSIKTIGPPQQDYTMQIPTLTDLANYIDEKLYASHTDHTDLTEFYSKHEVLQEKSGYICGSSCQLLTSDPRYKSLYYGDSSIGLKPPNRVIDREKSI